jgi:hypothetical protein
MSMAVSIAATVANGLKRWCVMPLTCLAVLSVGLVAVAGCSVPERGPSVSQADTTRAVPLGIPNARFFADVTLSP